MKRFAYKLDTQNPLKHHTFLLTGKQRVISFNGCGLGLEI